MAEVKLTRAQAQAVSARGSNLLVSAAAGSGKTKVLVDRLMGYLTDPADPANLDEFLIITYTTAAAAELADLRQRLRAVTSGEGRGFCAPLPERFQTALLPAVSGAAV